jgi:hypothetical protein
MRSTRTRSSGSRGFAGRLPVAWAAGVLLLGPTACYEGYRLQGEASGDIVDASAGDEAADTGPVCPGNLAGRMDRDIGEDQTMWMIGFASYGEIAADETVVVRFAIIPFTDDNTTVELADAAPQLRFMPDGFVTDDWRVPGFVPYIPGAWNIVEWTIHPVAGRATFEVNGIAQRDYPLFPGFFGLNLEALKISWLPALPSGSDPGPTAWIDGLSVVVQSSRGTTTLVADNFPTPGPVEHWGYGPSVGHPMRAEEPPVRLDDPIGCEGP